MLDLADPRADLPAMELPDSLLHTLDLDPKGETMVGIGPDGTLRQWDVALGVMKASIPADPGAGRYGRVKFKGCSCAWTLHVSSTPCGVRVSLLLPTSSIMCIGLEK
jgi:hypothetical protein